MENGRNQWEFRDGSGYNEYSGAGDVMHGPSGPLAHA
jgi:hypothetical protein